MSKKVLYVSNHDPSGLLKHMKEQFPADWNVANNRDEVKVALERDRYDVVVMTDLALAPGVTMPGESPGGSLRNDYQRGIEVAVEVKEKGLPLYIITSAGRDFQGELRRIGAEGVFRKPGDLREFYQALRDFFAR